MNEVWKILLKYVSPLPLLFLFIIFNFKLFIFLGVERAAFWIGSTHNYGSKRYERCATNVFRVDTKLVKKYALCI
jgi:hypothetical protein